MMRLPAVGVHVHHSVTIADDDSDYHATGDVIADMREIERIGRARFGLFSYSYCGHPSGWVGEGAGLTIGAHTAGWNSTTFGYCFIGNYDVHNLTDSQVAAFNGWRALMVGNGWLSPTHWIEPHRVRKATACPGQHTMERWSELIGGDALPVPPITPIPAGGVVLRRGSTGPAVRRWQTVLAGAGLLPSSGIDGVFGPRTEQATRNWQAILGVAIDGIVGSETNAATSRVLAWVVATQGQAPGVPPFPGLVRRGSRGAAVRAVQQRLRDRGWRITVDGVFGADTERIVRAFQADKGLTVDGIAGPDTWRALWTSPIT
jgi:peptidoglycan hydrolase-like protein with peptidoglycan-binding domain